MAIKYEKYTDEELVQLLKDGSGEVSSAFKVLYDRYSSVIHSYCVKVLGYTDEADDIFQDTFIKFYQNVTKETLKFNVKGYLLTICRNLCLNAKRNKKINVSEGFLETMYDDTQQYEQKELLDLLNRTLELLDDDYREAYVLREYNGLEYSEIAELTGISVANAKSRVFRAKQKIKTILQPYLKELT